MSKVIMSTARNVFDDGSTELVQVPGTPYEAGHHYYSPQHHRNLVCLHCDAKVHLNTGADSLVGSFKGRSAHFHTNPGQTHKDCLWPLRDHTPPGQWIDNEIGYRIHINTLRSEFNSKSGVYTRTAKGHIAALDKTLQSREAYSVRSAKDLLTLMRKGELNRINDSVIIFNNRPLPWRDFFLYLKEPERYSKLLERLKFKGKFEPAPVVFMEVDVPRGHHANKFSDKSSFNAGRIRIGTDKRGFGEFIVPGINVRHAHNTHLRDVFLRPGRYLVMATPTLNSKELDRVTYHYLNMEITDVRQVYFGNIADIAKEAKMNAQKRDANPPHGIASP